MTVHTRHPYAFSQVNLPSILKIAVTALVILASFTSVARATTMATVAPGVALVFASTGNLSPSPAASFAGISPANATPPDSHGAVSATHVVTHINGQAVIQDRNGNTLASVGLTTFWASLGVADVFDPKVIYDPHSDRFIAVACAQRRLSSSGMLLGVTATSDPMGTWHLWLLDADSSNTNWLDYPNIGLTADKITLTGNLFSNAGDAFSGVNIWVLNKSTVLDGGGFSSQLMMVNNAGGTLVPALTFDPSETTQYIVRAGTSSLLGTGRLQVYSLTGTIGSMSLDPVPYASIAAPWSTTLPNAPQQGSSVTIETNDDRIMNAVLRNGHLWTVHTVALDTASRDHTAVKWWEIEPVTGLTIQSGVIEDLGTDNAYDPLTEKCFYYPAITVNAANEALVGFSGSSALEYVSAYFAFRSPSYATGQFDAPFKYKAGLGTYTGPRWGDYSAAVVDPADDTSFWTVQEFAAGGNKGGNWWSKVNPSTADVTAPQVSGALVLSSTTVRISFDEAMLNNAQLLSPTYYTFSGGLVASSVTRLNANQVVVTVNEMKNGTTYTATVSTAGPTDLAGNKVSVTNKTATFVGLGIPPTVQINLTDPNPTNLNTVRFSLNFSESVGTTLGTSDLSLTGTLAAGSSFALSGGPVQFSVSVTPSNANAEGTLGLIVGTDVADLAGNPFGGAASVASYVLDNTPPTVTVSSRITKDNTPPLSGAVNDGTASVIVTVAGQTRTATNNGNGTWSLADNSLTPLVDGTYNVTATAQDPAGNIRVDNTINELLIDTTAPVISVSSLTTRDATPALSGTLNDSSATIRVSVGGQSNISATNNGNGTWTLADNILSSLADGTYDVVARAMDKALNASNDVTVDELRIDTTAPAIAVAQLTTFDTSPPLGGSVDDPTAVIMVAVGGKTYPATNGGTTWSLADNTIAPPLAAGTYDIVATATDAAGNSRSDTTNSELVIKADTASLPPDLYVNGTTGSDTTGTGSQENPWASIARAVTAAQGTANNTFYIHVASGVYTNPSGALSLNSYEHLLGGYEGTGWTRDIDKYSTVIEANGSSANAVVLDGVVDAVLDGFTVRGVETSTLSLLNSAGILATNLDSSSVISNCTITQNSVNVDGNGGLRLINASPRVEHCIIADNYSLGAGGGLGIMGNSAPILERCTVVGNGAWTGGGGIAISGNSDVLIANCVISFNYAQLESGSGVHLTGGYATLANCTVSRNESTLGQGAGISATDTAGFAALNSIFSQNIPFAVSLPTVLPSASVIEYCLFDNNRDGAFYSANSGNPVLITGASSLNAQLAGATNNIDGDPMFALPGGTLTGININNPLGRVTLSDSSANFTPGKFLDMALFVTSSSGARHFFPIRNNSNSTIEIDSSFSSEVAVADSYQILDFHLESGSAAIDTGRDTSAARDGGITVDMEGINRGYDGDGLGRSTADGSDYDIGAYESETLPLVDFIRVISPNGGETLVRGTTTEIIWTSSGSVGNFVKIIARKGATASVLAGSTPNDGSYSWKIPSAYPLGPGMTIEISSVATPAIMDTSDAAFTLSDSPAPAGTITVTAPNTGGLYLQGATLPISWTTTGSVGADVQIFARGGGQSFTVASSTANDGAFNWAIPADMTTAADYVIEVRSSTTTTIADSSDVPFTIASLPPANSISVISPNGGETFVRGTATEIRWTSSGTIGSTVKITVRKGTAASVLAGATPNDGSYTWNIPATYPLGPGMIVEISSVLTPSISDSSDSSFTLSDTPPPAGSITVNSPNGGESYVQGAEVPITWTSTGTVGSAVQIFAVGGDGQIVTVVSSTANVGLYNWSVPLPLTPGANYIIEVRSLSNPAITDSSNAPFSIASLAPTDSIILLAPNGGETILRGTTVEVRWTSIGNVGDSVKITARKGTSSSVLAGGTPNDGSYLWKVPSAYPLGPGMTLEISSTSDPSIVDSSDSDFTLAP